MDSDTTIDRDSVLSESNETFESSLETTESTLGTLMGTTIDSVSDTSFDETIAIDENANPNATIRIELRSGEIKIKDGISQKLVVTEVRTPKTKRRNIDSGSRPNQGGAEAVAGPSGMQNMLRAPSMVNSNQLEAEMASIPVNSVIASERTEGEANQDDIQQNGGVAEMSSNHGQLRSMMNADASHYPDNSLGLDLQPTQTKSQTNQGGTDAAVCTLQHIDEAQIGGAGIASNSANSVIGSAQAEGRANQDGMQQNCDVAEMSSNHEQLPSMMNAGASFDANFFLGLNLQPTQTGSEANLGGLEAVAGSSGMQNMRRAASMVNSNQMEAEMASVNLGIESAKTEMQTNQDGAGSNRMQQNNNIGEMASNHAQMNAVAAYDPDISFDLDLLPSTFDPWFHAMDAYNRNVDLDQEKKNEDKTNAALLDARLKVIEAHLKIIKADPDPIPIANPNEVIVINDSEDEESQQDFNPPISSTRIKDENQKE